MTSQSSATLSLAKSQKLSRLKEENTALGGFGGTDCVRGILCQIFQKAFGLDKLIVSSFKFFYLTGKMDWKHDFQKMMSFNF